MTEVEVVTTGTQTAEICTVRWMVTCVDKRWLMQHAVKFIWNAILQEKIPTLLNGTTFNDPERPLISI